MANTKVIPFYLPQFHTIPENDKWWGKGFTEWTNVRKAKPYRKGQSQPRVPLNENYYDLSKVETLRWQAELAAKYGIYGFCFYHYWFNGKLLLEKPSQNLLANKDISLRFCFSWANEPWARTWDGKNREVLMPQDYGNYEDWKKHFEYLLPFFKDDRYIKVDGKPMFLIYKSASIDRCEDMMISWNNFANNHGFPGIHFVETLKRWLPETRVLPFDAKVEFEPTGAKDVSSLYLQRMRRYSIRLINKLFRSSFPEHPKVMFADEAAKSLQNLSPVGTYPGAFIGWDNSPRIKEKGVFISRPTKDQFKDYIREKIRIGKEVYKTNFLFINAWNEWAEGTYLEPDTEMGYAYLEAIQEVLSELDA